MSREPPRRLVLLLATAIATGASPLYAQTPPPPAAANPPTPPAPAAHAAAVPPPPAPPAPPLHAATIPPPPAPPAAPANLPPPVSPAVAAATESAAGDKAAKAKDWPGAIGHFQASLQAAPTAHAQLGVADAFYQLGQLGDAFDAYTEAQRAFVTKLAYADKTLVTARLKELTAKTGALSIHVEEAGSDVALDGKPLGTSPIAALVRVPVGTHEVRVSRTGFIPFVGAADVQADGKAVVDANPLVAQSTAGHVVVRASGTEPLRVIVDGLDLGATPWEGDLPSGPHQIAGRSSSAVAAAQTITLNPGDHVGIDLVSSATAAHLQVRTDDNKGLVYLDGVSKGEGGFEGDVAPGAHTIVVEREGYVRFEKSLSLGERETWAETVSLKPVPAVTSEHAAERAFSGIYGGFGLTALFGVGGQGTDLDTSCSSLGASSCDTGQPVGGGLFGYVGYTFDPVGFEIMVAASGDALGETAHFTNTGSNATSPLATPARTEKFTFVRAGGLAALRVRATLDGRIVRGSIAGGVGFAYKTLLMKRDTATTGGSPTLVDTYSPTADGQTVSYFSPAITLEASAEIRVTPTVAFTAGVLMWADNASTWGSNSSTAPTTPRYLVAPNATPVQVSTPAYHLASGAQAFIGPFVGMAFGP